MSYRAYETFSVQPNFVENPFVGIANTGRQDTKLGMVESFSAWTGTTALGFRFRYRCQNSGEAKVIRDFLNTAKGRWGAFYLPSWQQDFRLIASAAAGDTTITVSEFGFAELAADRPDTEGRVIFALTAEGQFQQLVVVSAIQDGDNEILTLDRKIINELEPGATMMGLCYLCRQTDDEAMLRYQAPGKCDVTLKFTTVRNTRQVGEVQLVESIETGNAMAFVDLIATDEDPIEFDLQIANMRGPVTYGAPQATPYYTDWTAVHDGTDVTLERVDGIGGTTASSLYDGSDESPMLRACFDAVSKEVFAWVNSSTTIRVGHFVAGSETYLTFPGISPVVANTWPIDSGAATAGDGEVVCYYLKPGYSSIFCRLKGDDFAIEYQAIRSPSEPLFLHEVAFNGQYLEIRGTDTMHRRVAWRAEYEPPIPPEVLTASLEMTAGSLDLRVIAATPDSDEMGATIEMAEGSLDLRIIEAASGPDGAAADIAMADGQLINRIISDDVGDEVIGAELVMTDGAYTLIAKTGTATDGAGADISMTDGTYAIP